MKNKMTEKYKGFRISLDATINVLKIRLWGYWDVELGKEYLRELKAQLNKVSKNERKDWYLLMDLTEYRPQSKEILHMIGEGLALLKEGKIEKRAILVLGSIIQLPREHLAQEAGSQIYSYFRSEDDAVQWLLDETIAL
jgi:serine/threonine-protein kinase